MKYILDMGSLALIYMKSFITLSSATQKLTGEGKYTESMVIS
jgi:hypothetical protein